MQCQNTWTACSMHNLQSHEGNVTLSCWCFCCSGETLLQPTGTVKSPTDRLSIQLSTSAATALALTTELVDSVLSKSPALDTNASLLGYQMLGQLALADVQDGNERMKGVAQRVASSSLMVSSELVATFTTYEAVAYAPDRMKVLAVLCPLLSSSSVPRQVLPQSYVPFPSSLVFLCL